MGDRHILIVDDSVTIRTGLKRNLETFNAEIMEAADGREGLDLALNNSFDLIITDFDMPRMNGVEFCQRLKSDPLTRGIPVIMLSSFDSDSDINRGFEAGASAYVSKHEARSRLNDVIEEILSKSNIQRQQLIMVVDDSHAIRHLVENGLAQAGFQVITADNGRKALDFLTKKRPDLIISDIDMPEMNGFAFCEAVHKDPDLASIPFVVMSSNNQRGYMKRMLENGAAAYMVKPFNLDQLVILVEKLLSDHFLLLLKERERLDTERRMMLASITSLVSALEARDSYTRGHSEAVARIVSGLVTLTGGSKEEIESVAIGGRLHDIGKIGVKDSILSKPGRLTSEEFAVIQQHPLTGANILKSIPSLMDIIPIVLSHHERLDGKGYPQGLKGDEIPQWSRMTAVADTYHALTSDRPYRNSMPDEKALQIIDDVKGTQLCPDCVELFFNWLRLNKNKKSLI